MKKESSQAPVSLLRNLASRLWYVPFWVVAIAVFLQVPVAYPIDEHDRQMAQKIESLGGNVSYHSFRQAATEDWMEDSFSGVSTAKSIRSVFLRNAAIPADVLAELKSLTDLDQLFIQGCTVTDEGLVNLSLLKNLSWLNLSGSSVTDTGLKQLKEMPRLEVLVLTNTQITDEGLQHVVGLTGLDELYLGNTMITDAGLKQLSELKGLTRVGLYNTQTTAEGRALFSKSLPNCTIDPLD